MTNLNPERIAENRKYVMRITGDEQEGKAELDNFIDPESRYRLPRCAAASCLTWIS